MKFDRGPEFRRPSVGPYRKTRFSRFLEIFFGVLAKGTKAVAILITIALCLLVEGSGISGGLPCTRRGWLVLLGTVLIITLLIFLLVNFWS